VHNSAGRAFYVRNPYWHERAGHQMCIRTTGGATWVLSPGGANDGSGKVIGY
jgi:hypothetical protein